MRFSLLFSTLLFAFCQYVEAKAVFAHFMVSNTGTFAIADWQNNFNLAKASKLDAFAMNIGRTDPNNVRLLDDAFSAAASVGFQLFLNFDYVAGGVWTSDEVVALVLRYRDLGAYYKYSNNRPLVSTFEGGSSFSDWITIKDQTNAYFVPSWSSFAPGDALNKGVADGLASWDAWPIGINDMFTNIDVNYKNVLGGKPYMMPVSPWFFSNMPRYNKNWVWRGDSLWYDRWNQVLKQQPEFVQIISWNDFGESHYIGPLDTKQYAAFASDHGNAPYNYADVVPHDGWRKFLPYMIDLYKSGTTTITKESVVAWYRKSSAVLSVCSNGGTTGNTASKLQDVFGPSQLLQDRVYYSALLGSPANVTVSIGGVSVTAGWEADNIPIGGIGIYHGSVNFAGKNGTVVVSIRRGSSLIIQMTGHAIATTCPKGIQNYNPYVGSKDSTATISVKPLAVTDCNAGTGPGRYVGLCQFTCRYGYCPDVCTCNLMGPKPTDPAITSTSANCPNTGYDKSFLGLCDYHCRRGPCSPSACKRIAAGVACNPPDPVAPTPNICKAGTSLALMPYFAPLCEFTCRYGKCPFEICVCTQASQPPVNAAPALTGASGYNSGIYGSDYGLCEWACARGTCPTDVCVSNSAARKAAETKIDSSTVSSATTKGSSETKTSTETNASTETKASTDTKAPTETTGPVKRQRHAALHAGFHGK